MPDTWIIDARHYPEGEEDLRRIPGPALNFALFVRSIIGWVSSRPPGVPEPTNVWCRRRPGGQRCLGEIVALLDERDTIIWECPACGDNGVISGWRGSLADRGARMQDS